MKKFSTQLAFLASLAILSIISMMVFLYSDASSAATSPDAIAVRIIPNPNHYSPSRWYSTQKFSGSPQSITVDGYDAVRDGRTVYVNVANVVDTSIPKDGINDKLYTNIYLISYNQSAETATVDIFGQILQHWKFNANIYETGSCSKAADRACLNTSECSAGEYCSSVKSKIIRDTRRLADLADLTSKIDSYKSAYGYYPKLSSGSYLANKTISTWPSWQGTLAAALGGKLPVDPINQLGSCADNFDQATCWDEDTKSFGGNIDSSAEPAHIDLPTGSNVYTYSVTADGTGYSLTMGTESGSLGADGGFSYSGDSSSAGSDGTINEYAGEVENKSSVFTGYNLPDGSSGKEYSGFIEGENLDGNPIIWSVTKVRFNNNGTDAFWQSGQGGMLESFMGNTCMWDTPEILKSTQVSDQKKIGAKKMGKPGTYTFTVVLDDKKNKANSKTSKDFTIKVTNEAPNIYISDPSKDVVIGKNLDYIPAKADDPNDNYPLSFSVSTSDAGAPAISCLSEEAAGSYAYQCRVKADTVAAKTQEYAYSIKAIDYYGVESQTAEFRIKIENNAPTISTAALPEATACTDYGYQMSASDPDGHAITRYVADSLPGDMSISNEGRITGVPRTPGNYSVDIHARDAYYDYTVSPYSASGDKTFQLKVKDEVFSVSISSSDDIIYLTPAGVPVSSLYHSNLSYEAQASVSTQNSVTYQLQNQPSWISINQNTGSIQGTPTSAGSFSFNIKATNACGASASANITITVENNEYCGDSIKNGTETCDKTQASQSCTSTFATGLPAYCSGIEVTGTQTCKSDCTAWNACSVGDPETVGQSSTSCGYTSPQMNDYSCCQITSCSQDGCGCCGRTEGAQTVAGYNLLSSYSPCGGLDGSCRISQSQANPRNWVITTNHTTAAYQCWR